MPSQIEKLAATAPMPKPIQPESATGVENTALEERPAPYTDAYVTPITPGTNVGDRETVYIPQSIQTPSIAAPQSVKAPTNLPVSIKPTEQQAPEVAPAPIVDTSEQPSGIGNLTNGQLTYLRQQTGWDDNKLNSVYGKEYDPEKGGSFLTNLYQSVKKKPTELTPEREEAARATAGIGQSLQLLGDMYAAGKGAHVQSRDLSQGPVANTDKNIKDVQKLYEAQQDQYENGLLNAKLQDYQTGKQEFNQNRAEITTHLRELRAMEAESKKQAIELQKWQAEYGLKKGTELFNENMKQKEFDQKGNQFNQDMTLKNQAQNETARNNAAQNGISKQNANTNEYSAHHKGSTSFISNYGYSSTDPNKEVLNVSVPWSIRDKTNKPIKGIDGNPIAVLQVNKEEVPMLANKARQMGTDWLKNHQFLKVSGSDAAGDPTYTLNANDEQLATAMAQDDYVNKHKYQLKDGEFRGTDGKVYRKVYDNDHPENQQPIQHHTPMMVPTKKIPGF